MERLRKLNVGLLESRTSLLNRFATQVHPILQLGMMGLSCSPETSRCFLSLKLLNFSLNVLICLDLSRFPGLLRSGPERCGKAVAESRRNRRGVIAL